MPYSIVGDVDQMLMRFAGATPEENMGIGVEKLFPDVVRLFLETNYRSTVRIVQTAKNLIRHNYQAKDGPYEQRFFKEGAQARPDAPEGEKVTFKMYAAPAEEAENTVLGILDDIEEHNLTAGDFFILSRTRAQSAWLEGPLVRAKLPYVNLNGGSFFSLKHVAVVLGYIRLAIDPADDAAFKEIYNVASELMTVPWGNAKNYGEYCNHRFLGEAFLKSCAGQYRNAEKAARRWKKFQPGVADLQMLILSLQASFADLETLDEIIDTVLDLSVRRWLIKGEGISTTEASEDGKFEDFEVLKELASTFDSVDEFLSYTKECQASAAKPSRDITDWEGKVVLSTVHKVKGLEREVAYTIGVSETEDEYLDAKDEPAGLLPHTFSKIDPPQFGMLPAGGRGRIADERCILYVAITRAKSLARLSGTSSYRKKKFGPSRFVYEMVDDLEVF